MSYAAVTANEGANLIETQYRKRFGLDATERLVIAADFDDATEGLSKVGKQVVIRKISAKNANTATATSATDPAITRGPVPDCVSGVRISFPARVNSDRSPRPRA